VSPGVNRQSALDTRNRPLVALQVQSKAHELKYKCWRTFVVSLAKSHVYASPCCRSRTWPPPVAGVGHLQGDPESVLDLIEGSGHSSF